MSSLIYNKLNNYWLWKEISRKLGVSNPAYRYWKTARDLKLNNKYVFLQKETLPDKYCHIEKNLTDLSGYLPTRFASDSLHVDNHIFTYDKMKLYKSFEYKYVEDVKFVNIRRFFREHGIRVKPDSILHLGKLQDLEITPTSQLYRIEGDYGVVVYDD
jgi:hypothetical protein